MGLGMLRGRYETCSCCKKRNPTEIMIGSVCEHCYDMIRDGQEAELEISITKI